MAVFVYIGVRRVTPERRDSSVCLSLLGSFPRTQEAGDITLGIIKNTLADRSRRKGGGQNALEKEREDEIEVEEATTTTTTKKSW